MSNYQDLLIKVYDILVAGYNDGTPYTAVYDSLKLLEENKLKELKDSYDLIWNNLENAKTEVAIMQDDEDGKYTYVDDVVFWDDILDIMKVLER